MSRGTYGTSVNTGIGRTLGAGNDSSTLQNIQSPVAETADKAVVSTHSWPYQSGLDMNHLRTTGFVNIVGKVEDIAGVANNDFYLTQNGDTDLEQHSYKYGRKLAITSIDNHGNITYDATNGTIYGLYPTSGTPVDRFADAAKDPWGTPARFVTLEGSGPVIHSFENLTEL